MLFEIYMLWSKDLLDLRDYEFALRSWYKPGQGSVKDIALKFFKERHKVLYILPEQDER